MKPTVTLLGYALDIIGLINCEKITLPQNPIIIL